MVRDNEERFRAAFLAYVEKDRYRNTAKDSEPDAVHPRLLARFIGREHRDPYPGLDIYRIGYVLGDAFRKAYPLFNGFVAGRNGPDSFRVICTLTFSKALPYLDLHVSEKESGRTAMERFEYCEGHGFIHSYQHSDDREIDAKNRKFMYEYSLQQRLMDPALEDMYAQFDSFRSVSGPVTSLMKQASDKDGSCTRSHRRTAKMLGEEYARISDMENERRSVRREVQPVRNISEYMERKKYMSDITFRAMREMICSDDMLFDYQSMERSCLTYRKLSLAEDLADLNHSLSNIPLHEIADAVSAYGELTHQDPDAVFYDFTRLGRLAGYGREQMVGFAEKFFHRSDISDEVILHVDKANVYAFEKYLDRCHYDGTAVSLDYEGRTDVLDEYSKLSNTLVLCSCLSKAVGEGLLTGSDGLYAVARLCVDFMCCEERNIHPDALDRAVVIFDRRRRGEETSSYTGPGYRARKDIYERAFNAWFVDNGKGGETPGGHDAVLACIPIYEATRGVDEMDGFLYDAYKVGARYAPGRPVGESFRRINQSYKKLLMGNYGDVLRLADAHFNGTEGKGKR